MPTVKFINEKKDVEVEEGANLRLVALEHGIDLHHHGFGVPSIAAKSNCSLLSDLARKALGQESGLANVVGGGFCGTCYLYVKKGTENCSKAGVKERVHLLVSPFSIGHEPEMRLACQTTVHGDIEVETHPRSNYFGEKFW